MPADTTKSTKAIMSGMRQLEIRTRRMVNDSLAGEYHSVFKGRGMDFDEVREYTPGDEVRTIDWNVTARAGRPFCDATSIRRAGPIGAQPCADWCSLVSCASTAQLRSCWERIR